MKCPSLVLNNLSSIGKNQHAVIYAFINVLFWSTVATAFKIGRKSFAALLISFAGVVLIASQGRVITLHSILSEKIHLTTIIGIIFIVSGILFQQTDKTRNIKNN